MIGLAVHDAQSLEARRHRLAVGHRALEAMHEEVEIDFLAPPCQQARADQAVPVVICAAEERATGIDHVDDVAVRHAGHGRDLVAEDPGMPRADAPVLVLAKR